MLLPLVQAFAIVALTADARPLALVVADLGSPDFCVREAASDELARAGDVYRLADLEKALEDPALTAEQRLRLDGAAFRAFADSPRAALGVRFAQAINDRTEIESLTDGFPAAVILKPRDVIREIDGQTVSSRISADGSWSTVRALIISHDPGDSVRIVVDRAGVKTPLTVPLGDFTRLGQSAVATSVELRAAWQHRLRRRLEAAGAGAAAGPLGVSALIDATALRGGHIDMSGRPADPMDQGFVKRAAVGDTPSVAPGATPDKARRASTDATVGAGFAQPFNRANGFGGLAAPVLDRQELARLSDAELKDERRRLMAEAQMFSIFLDQQKDFGGRAPVREFVDLLNRTRQQLDAVTGEISRRREARQPKPAEPPAPPTRAPADDQKPDQKADKP